ncbi:spore gernimation protein [Bacillus pseudomycoides]|uniref:Spore gernimation protein n=1 Tax=Bacillus pseudomycoides TaxID=64104 RepID=A0AA91V9C9_9BACI|nr:MULTISPECIES: Ger(x)C family spore germination protein [Bacillus]PEB50516.1 spore gernimation protein [Bacillus sp. AFS098217]PED81031.1 spore gernimation protein [Bacillus pseudomycoides]PEU05453.1 spore gernimation protein [Bacillus sp. AFS019443]PEU18053.1 spore gernimation protein [Bacillus sp. AFS014408]PFW62197.1 spore gernimation protein [Bacillus sp. AFS075034]
MKPKILCSILIPILLLTGCLDQMNVEDVTLTLILGLDLDENDNLKVYLSSPVFNKEAKIKEEQYGVKAVTVRNSREKFDTMVMALTSGSKTQIILIGKRLLKQKKWADYLDPFYRDPKNTVTTKIVAVDGPVSDIIYYSPKNKPRLPVYLAKLLETAHRRNITVKTTLQDFHNQTKEKGMTTSISAIKKNSDIKLTGSALFDEQNRYKLTITPEENKLLRILQNKIEGEFPFTIAVPLQSNSKDKHWLSFISEGTKVKTSVQYKDRFIFNINVHMRILISERLFPFNVRNDGMTLEQKIQKQLKTDFQRLIKKIQIAEIDPIGLGLYARAYTYEDWKKVQHQWEKSLAKADVNVKVRVKISGMGTIK